jgi:NAD(P)-dependent dehydrogenase (short-subunit alcohol dehydrogenase family)
MEKLDLLPTAPVADCLKDQVILITGASQGIGRTLALHAAKHGATVIILGKSVKKLESLYDEIVTQGYAEPAIHPINLLNMTPDDAQNLASSIRQMFGRLDAVVHNAGSVGQITPLEHLPPDKWQTAIHLNLNVPFLLTQALLPLMRENNNASILFTTAQEGLQGKAYWSAYSASKFGIVGLAQSLYEELQNNTAIRVNCINPGVVRTAMRVNAYPGIDPLEFIAPEDIMPTYLYLLSEQAKTINGKWVNC